MNYAELHAYITTIQAIINSLHLANPPGMHLAKLKEIKRLTDLELKKAK